MVVTLIFKSSDRSKHNSQAFNVTTFEIHNAYNFLELMLTDGSSINFNLDDVFSFQVVKQ